jgi:hypothetical protein
MIDDDRCCVVVVAGEKRMRRMSQSSLDGQTEVIAFTLAAPVCFSVKRFASDSISAKRFIRYSKSRAEKLCVPSWTHEIWLPYHVYAKEKKEGEKGKNSEFSRRWIIFYTTEH